MSRVAWRAALKHLVCDVIRVVLAYALVLQMLAPIAIARAEAGAPPASGWLCSSMLPGDAGRPAEPAGQIVHDCLSCCLSSIVAIVPAAMALPATVVIAVPLRRTAASVVMRRVPDGSPPPQRAPPSSV